MTDRYVAIAEQVARIERAAAFLANGLSLGSFAQATVRRGAMSARLIGNGLRELDLFLTDLIAEARRIDRLGVAVGRDPGIRPGRRIYSAAEAWRRAGPQLGLAVDGRARLRQMRATQNRHCFGGLREEDGGAAMQVACADYARLAGDVLAALRGRAAAPRVSKTPSPCDGGLATVQIDSSFDPKRSGVMKSPPPPVRVRMAWRS